MSKTGKDRSDSPEAATEAATEDPSLATTLPTGFPQERPPRLATLQEPSDEEPLSSAARTSRSIPVHETAGSVPLYRREMPEETARSILRERFTEAGFSIEVDYPFRHGRTMVTLDGYDPKDSVGYQFVSHTGADVVTDHDSEVEHALKSLLVRGLASVLVIHDVSTSSREDLHATIDEFLAKLSSAIPRASD